MIAQLDSTYIKTRPFKIWPRIISHFFFQGRFLGTKYRLLNKAVLKNLYLLQQLPLKQNVEKPIFIVGMGRSGSTILGKILSLHPDVGFLNEPKALWYIVDKRHDIVGHFQNGEAQYRLASGDVTKTNRKTARKLFHLYSKVTASKRVLDKNPEILYRIAFVRKIFPDAKFIFLTRNGWDTIYSVTHWWQHVENMVNPKNEAWWGSGFRKWHYMIEQLVLTDPLLAPFADTIRMYNREEDMAAVEWVLAMREGLNISHKFPESVLLLRFEKFVYSPEVMLNRLCHFVDLDVDEKMMTYARKVLVPKSNRPKIKLSSTIEALFHQTLTMLDYD